MSDTADRIRLRAGRRRRVEGHSHNEYGARILVRRDADMFHVRRVGEAVEPEICLAVDLFEVIADVVGLDLEREAEAAEAIELANDARRRLRIETDEADR